MDVQKQLPSKPRDPRLERRDMTISADAGKQGIVGKLTLLNVKAGAVSAG